MLLQARIFYSPKKLFCGVLHTSWPVAQEQSSPGEILTKNLESDGSAQNFFTPGVRTLTHPEVWENRFTLNRFGSGGHPLGGNLVTASKLNHEPIRNVSFLSEPIKSRKNVVSICRHHYKKWRHLKVTRASMHSVLLILPHGLVLVFVTSNDFSRMGLNRPRTKDEALAGPA